LTAPFFDPVAIPGSAPGWPVLVLLIALIGTAVAFAARARPGLAFAGGLLAWAAIAVVVGAAWREAGGPAPQLLTMCGIGVIGVIAWLCAPATEIAPRRRAWLPAIVLALTCGAFGATGARDLLVATIWLSVIGAASFALTLAVAGDKPSVRALLATETLALLTAALALVFFGLAGAQGKIAPQGSVPALAAAGLIMVTAHLLLRAGSALASLSILARPGALGAELAVGALALPAILATLLRILAEFAPVWPPGLGVTLAAIGGIATIACAGAFIGAQRRGRRLAFLGASLAGLALLIVGASASHVGGEILAELLFVPFAAIIAGSSLRRNMSAMRDAAGPGFGGALELGLSLAAFGVIGLPPFAGFWPRMLLMDASIKTGDFAVPATVIAGSLLLAYGLVRSGAGSDAPQPRPVAMRALEVAAFGVLLGLSLAAGLSPALEASGSIPTAEIGAATAVSEAQ
jgi:multicomponent Na+:H+ antiporter subunit D